MHKLLVTGCAGFIGSHVCELLLSKGYEVIGVDNFDPFYPRGLKEKNLSHFSSHPGFKFYETDIVNGLQDIKEPGIDVIIHLAAKAGVRPSIMQPTEYIKTNIIGTQKVHEFMQANAIHKLVFASSSSVYGNNKSIPFKETDNVDNPISPYAFTKKAGELMNYAFHHLEKADIINLRFFTVYGPRQRPDLAINKFVKKIEHNEQLEIYGDGHSARDYTYVSDTVAGIYNAIIYCIENKGFYHTINLGNKNPVKLIDLVDTIYSNMNTTKNVQYKDMQPGDVDITFADITVAKSILNYNPSIDLNTGIKLFIEWHKNNTKKSS
jgi:UDP-glucuronate 4-epimerase